MPDLTPPQPTPKPPVAMRDFVDPVATRQAIYDKTFKAVADFKPLTNKKYTLSLAGVGWADPPEFTKADVKKATLEGRTLSRRLRGVWSLHDVETGKHVASKKATLAEVPYHTDDGVFVINGSHWSLASQSRLLPGVYTRRKENGELESHVNVVPGSGLSHRIGYDPESGLFHAKFSQSRYPLATIMKALGVPEHKLREAWGPVASANIAKADSGDIAKLAAKIGRRADPDLPAAAKVAQALLQYPLDPEVTHRTLGHPYDKVGPDVYLAASKKLMQLARNEVPPDDRDHLAFMTTLGPEELLSERVGKDLDPVRRAFWKATFKGNLSGMPAGVFTSPIMAAIQSSGLGQSLEEINPLGALEQRGRLSRMGTGGLPSTDSIPEASRSVQPSYFGLVDPIVTPENTRAGVDSRVASGVLKGDDGKLYSKFHDPRTGQEHLLHAAQIADKVVAFPGWRNHDEPFVDVMHQGRSSQMPREKIQLELPHMEYAFGPLSNLIPMKSGIKQQRLAMGARMTTQALPLEGAESPWVQSGTPENPNESFEERYGVHAGAVRAHTPGTVMDVKPDGVRVRHDDGSEHNYELEPFMPSNRKTYLAQEAAVQPLQRVNAGDLIARSNYTDKNGAIALGRNVRVGMLPGFGRFSNFEDAYLISSGLAQKLTSQHAYQHDVDHEDGQTLSKSAYVSAFPSKYAKAIIDNFDDDGVIKPSSMFWIFFGAM